jgi:hypothetical protein
MKRIVLIFGTILGILMCLNLIYVVHLMYTDPDLKSNDIAGYTIQIVIMSLTFFGIRNYRNNYLNGVITFGKAFKVGAFIALAGATIYVIFWMFYYYLAVPDFIDVFIPFAKKQFAANGATATELAAKSAELETLREMYKNPAFVVLITYTEVLPIGLIVALVSALILKKKAVTTA